jgi:hypothetical protein
MKSVLLSALFGTLAMAQYPENYIDFRGGTGGAKGGGDPRTAKPATSTPAAPKASAPAKAAGGAGAGGFGGLLGFTGGPNGAGSGPYKARLLEEQPLEGHTIYAPVSPPKNGEKWPGWIYHNNGCLAIGTIDARIVIELASYGYYIVVDGGVDAGFTGGPGGGPSFGTATDGFDAINWVAEQVASGKLPNVDATKFAVAGTSCGGMQSYTTLQDKRVLAAGIISSGLFGGPLRAKLNELKKPIGFFEGGSFDAGKKATLLSFSVLIF